MANLIKCLDCSKVIEQHSYNHVRCSMCSYAFNTKRTIERARAKRLAAKAS
jgi:DNA-directed RNA polymerase subunit RPC12/RpoP